MLINGRFLGITKSDKPTMENVRVGECMSVHFTYRRVPLCQHYYCITAEEQQRETKREGRVERKRAEGRRGGSET